MGSDSFVQVPPDSTGKKLFSQQHAVGADIVQAQVLHLADRESPDQMLAVDIQGSASVRFSEGQPTLSGFGSLKVSAARALGVYESSLDTYDALFSTITAVGGASSYFPPESSQVLSTTSASGSRAMLITNRYHYYQPGSSNLFKMTISLGDTGKANNTRRWGGFDDNDGVFFELQGTTLNAVIRNSTSGSVVETRVPSTAWSGDRLDGTGLSGYAISLTGINVYWIDYQWLGAGRVRFGVFAPDGSRVTCHAFQNAGANPLPYMRTGTLPVALENVNTGATGSSSELRSVCAAVYTEGDFADYAFWRFADVDASLAAVTTDAVAFSIRTLATYNGKHNSVVVYPETLNAWCDQPVAVTLWQNTVVTGGTWDALASACEVNYSGAVDTTDAQRFKTIYFGVGAKAFDLDQYFEKNDEGIMTGANGQPEVWSVLVTRLTASATNASLNLGYKELW
jgi:hypothetical protein